MCSHSFSALLCAALLLFGSAMAQGQSSTPISLQAEPLWTMLLQATADLPSQMQSFRNSMTEQLLTQQRNVSSLQDGMQLLRDSNESLIASNAISRQLNEDLTQSLAASQASLLISKSELKQSRTDLQSSMRSITKAQADAKGLEAQVSVLRIGCITLGVGLGAVAVYEGGHALKVW